MQELIDAKFLKLWRSYLVKKKSVRSHNIVCNSEMINIAILIH